MIVNLPQVLREAPFTYQEAILAGLNQYQLGKLLEEGVVERLERGVYQITNKDLSEEDLFRHAVAKSGIPSAICLLSALSYYELTDIIPKKVWVMVPSSKRTTSDIVRLYRRRNPKWHVGINSQKGFNITSLERTLLDSLTQKKLIPPRVGLDALKLAIKGEQTTIQKVLEMANHLGLRHRVLPYLEALS